MSWIWITFAVLCPNVFRIESIQTRIHRPIRFIDDRAYSTRHFRHIDSSVLLDWERGLREATVQALFREDFRDGNLKKHIYAAPFLGKQDKATPFGDIAILARGQLYANYAGFIFVQDPYQNDCDDCHNIDAADTARRRCISNHCQIWQPKNNEKLIALWTIKRIRHRSIPNSPKYEVEFTIAPVGLRWNQNEGYLTEEGTFNYNLAGHVFVLKGSDDTHQDLTNEQRPDHLKHGAFIAQTLDGRKYALHGFHGLAPTTARYNDLPPRYPQTPGAFSTAQYSEEDEKKVYQTLLDELHKKTSPESNSFASTLKTPTTLSDKTLVQLPDGHMVPITELETPFVTKTTPGYVTVRFPGGERQKVPTQEATVPNKVTPQSYGIMRPRTTIPTRYAMATSGLTTNHQLVAVTDSSLKETPPGVVYTEPKPFHTTKPPVKMTFHFFAAEEEHKTTPGKPLTTVRQEQYTEYENFLADTLVPTEPTVSLVSHGPITATTVLREITNYPTSSSTRSNRPTSKATKPNYPTLSSTKTNYPTSSITKPKYLTSSSTKSNYLTSSSTKQTFTTTKYTPAVVVKVTKPTVEDTAGHSSITTSSTMEPSTKIVPISSPSYDVTSKEAYTFGAPIMVLEEPTEGTTLDRKTTQQLQQVVTVTHAPKTTFEGMTLDQKTTQQLQQVVTVTHAPKTTFEGTTLDQKTTQELQQVVTVTHAPKTTFEGTTLDQKTTQQLQQVVTVTHADNPDKYTTFQQHGTTLFQTSAPTDTTLEFTTYTKIPTLQPGQPMETTKLMGTSQNKTTAMAYYVAEETQGTIGLSGTTEPTSNRLETDATTPKRIVTTIKADGTVAVKTTPLSADEELFGVTKSGTKRYKATKRPKLSASGSGSDFLVDAAGSVPDYKVPLFKKPSRDYSEDEIFGPGKSTTAKTSSKAVKHYTKSDLEYALFDTSNRKSKALSRRRLSTTETPPRVVYSLTSPGPAMSPVTIADVTTENVAVATVRSQHEAMAVHEEVKPVTSQSYLTSISYEVNKKKRLFDGKLAGKHPVKKADLTVSTGSSYTDTSFENDFALRLVGHAKGEEYLVEVRTTDASAGDQTTKKSKYTRRRSYIAKAKRPTRKKISIRREI